MWFLNINVIVPVSVGMRWGVPLLHLFNILGLLSLWMMIINNSKSFTVVSYLGLLATSWMSDSQSNNTRLDQDMFLMVLHGASREGRVTFPALPFTETFLEDCLKWVKDKAFFYFFSLFLKSMGDNVDMVLLVKQNFPYPAD